MKAKSIFYILFFLYVSSFSCTSNEVQNAKTEDMKMTVHVSNSFSNKMARRLNVNRTRVFIEYFNYSDENVVIQKPISGWNLFITLIDKDENVIHSKVFEFFTPIVDNSLFVSLNPLDKKVFDFKFSDFGTYRTSYNNISKIIIEYVPQKTHINSTAGIICFENYTLEFTLN